MILALNIETIWGLRHLRGLVDEYAIPIIAVLVIAKIFSQGYLHGAFYNRDYADPHFAAEIMGVLHFLLAYAAGLDPIQAVGAILVGYFLFQIPINLSSGKPVIDPNESREYDVAGHSWTWKRLFVGRGRWLQFAAGIVFLCYQPIFGLL